jgi:very-short-patch-repair endonuclease
VARSQIDLPTQLKAAGLPEPEREYRFHSTRKWRADFAYPDLKLLIEIEGGFFARKGSKRCPVCKNLPSGRHLTGKGARADAEKYNSATLLGFRLLRFLPEQVKSGEALTIIEAAIKAIQTGFSSVPIQSRLDL